MEQLKKYTQELVKYPICFLEWSKKNWKTGGVDRWKVIGAWYFLLLISGILLLRLLVSGTVPNMAMAEEGGIPAPLPLSFVGIVTL
jgi:hypothetical protein